MSTASCSDLQGCPYCGPHIMHVGICPRVKSVEYHENGTLKHVEFWDTRDTGSAKPYRMTTDGKLTGTNT